MSPTTSNHDAKLSRTLRAGQQLQGRYNLINRIATGGMGEVWKARDVRTGTLVAAKVLRPELTGEEISLSRLRIEARNAMRAHHPNIAAVLDSGENNGQGWIVMELVQGDPLTDFVGDGKRLTARELIPILSQTAFALDGAAQAGIVHRDIKPANIMIRPDGMVKLTDFGISYTDGQANLTAVGMVMGTAQYLAPEQAMGAVASHAGDLYALGIIAYEALAGYRPFTGKTVVDIAMAHVNDTVPTLPDDVPEELAEIVYWLLAKDPQDRPASGTSLVRALGQVAQKLGTDTKPVPLSRPAKPGPTGGVKGSAKAAASKPRADEGGPGPGEPAPLDEAAPPKRASRGLPDGAAQPQSTRPQPTQDQSTPAQSTPAQATRAQTTRAQTTRARSTEPESAPVPPRSTQAQPQSTEAQFARPRTTQAQPPRPVIRDWRPVNADSAAFATGRRAAGGEPPQAITPPARPGATRPDVRSATRPTAAKKPAPSTSRVTPSRGKPLPRRVDARRAGRAPSKWSRTRWWIALAVLALIVLIVTIALVHNSSQSSSLDSIPAVPTAPIHLEVETWLTPILIC